MLVAASDARADAPVGGDWSGLKGPLIAAFVIGNAVPDYSLVAFDGERRCGAQWDLPIELGAGPKPQARDRKNLRGKQVMD